MKGNQLLNTIIDLSSLQSLFESFHALCGVPVTLTDVNGNLLYKSNGNHMGAGWIKACSKYHRQCEATNKNCIISDTYLAKHLKSSKDFAIYTCLNGLVDLAVPVYHGEQHIANLFSGQFFIKKPNLSFYENMADRHGFDKKDYLESIKAVQQFDDTKVNHIIQFLKSLSSFISTSIRRKHSNSSIQANETGVRQLSEAVLKRNEILTTTLLSLEDYIYSLDANDCFESYYTHFRVGLLESDYDKIKGQHFSLLNINEKFKSDLQATIDIVKVNKQPSNFTFRLLNGNVSRHYKMTVAFRRDAFNNFGGTTLHIRDVTDEANTYEEIKKLMQIIDDSPVAIAITDNEARIQYVNQRFNENTGYTLEEVMGEKPNILKSGHTPAKTYQELWHQISQGKTWKGRFQNRRKDGSLFWEQCIISPIKNNGSISHYVAIKEDVTKKLALEQELLRYKNKLEERVVEQSKQLKKSQHDYKEIVEHLAGIVWEVNMDGMITFISPNISRYSEYSDIELIGKSIAYLFAPTLHNKLYDFIAHFPEEPIEFKDFEVFLDKYGHRTYLKASSEPIFDKNRQLTGIRGLSIDVTEQKERDKLIVETIWNAEEQLRTRISMELHDSIGATMSALSMYMNTLNTQIPDNSILQQVDSIIKTTATDIRMVARELKPPELETLGLAESLNAIRILYGQLDTVKIHLVTENLMVEPKQEIKLTLYRIISELISNGIKHGNATEVIVRLFNHSDDIFLLYEDNGYSDFNSDEITRNTGIGIQNIKTRVNTYGGICQFFPLSQCGLIVGLQLKNQP